MNDRNELRRLANAFVDGTATSTDAAQLSAILREHPEFHDEYLSYVETHASLCWIFREGTHATNIEKPVLVADVTQQNDESRWQSGGRRRLPWIVAVGATVVATVAVMLRPVVVDRNESELPEAIAKSVERSRYVVQLVDALDAEFAEGHGPQENKFGLGEIELRKGVVHLRFMMGADVVLAGPAQLDVLDPWRARLAYGTIRAIVPLKASGFTIATPDADYVDVGTEFGLRVHGPEGGSDLYVFDGQVSIEESQSGKLLSKVEEGTTTRRVDGVASAAPELNPEDFPTPGTIGFLRWQEHIETLRKDPSLIALFPFRRSDDEAALTGTATHQIVPDGRISGARWASGRWRGKDALLFDRDSDFVELNIPGEYQEFTTAVWLKLDRLDFEVNAILNSDHADVGDVHFQLTRQGLPRGGVLHPKVKNVWMGSPIPLGTWVHIASVISNHQRSQQIYVNGILARNVQFEERIVIRPGSSRLGNWLPAADWAWTTRGLKGRIDELALWSRVLTPNELERLVEAGRPSLLWSKGISKVVAPE